LVKPIVRNHVQKLEIRQVKTHLSKRGLLGSERVKPIIKNRVGKLEFTQMKKTHKGARHLKG